MAITEENRHRLYQRLEEVLGRDEATTMMEHLPPVGWADVATKRDLEHLDALSTARLDRVAAELRGELATMGAELRGELAEVKADLFDRMSQQTRALVFSLAGLNLTMVGLVLAAVKLG